MVAKVILAACHVLFLYTFFIFYFYVEGRSLAVNQKIYFQFYAKSWITTASLLILAFICKWLQFERIATLILAIPAGVTAAILLLSILVWIFVAAIFIIFGQ